ncbi:hypothetical protein PIB30_000827 [Stylosanthes scabra]|uniref:HhH-GPD domain-containing protein n=1 Tax=Stylosanthes scabra TaxID=79078 RepID=A0ABU6Q2E3_9FABA|nr:hypothetical protein [Stylosanthes scabra]
MGKKKILKRKHPPLESEAECQPKSKSVRVSSKSLTTTNPYSSHIAPTPHQCLSLRDTLLALHGFPPEFAKYRKLQHDNNNNHHHPTLPPETVLDGLVRTVLSQNTTESNSQKAFDSLKSSFPTWEHFEFVFGKVLGAESKELENAIRCGGLAPTKASCIKNMLRCLLEKRGKLCLEYLRDFSIDEVKAELSLFKGIGPKTVNLLFPFLFCFLLIHC